MSVLPPIVWYDEIDSTNAEARRRAEAGQVSSVWLAAKSQTAGRGRRGRSWEMSQGNLAATLFFVTSQPAAEVAQISFVAAIAVCEMAGRFVSSKTNAVKWPNDVMLGDAKASGILVESGRVSEGLLWVALGIGVNLAHYPTDTERAATSFAANMTTPPPTPEEALQALAETFYHWRGIWDAQGFAPIADAWTSRAYRLGQPATAHLPNETVDGIAEGLDADGALRLRLADGSVRRITAGDVFFGDA